MPRLSSLLLLLAASSLAAEDAVPLTHDPNLAPGDRTRTRIEINTDQTLTIAGMPLHTQVEQFMAINEEVGEPDAAGNVPVEGGMEFIVFQLSLPDGRTFIFDSGNPLQSNGIEELESIEELFRALIEAQWTSRYGPDRRIKSLEYHGDPFSHLDESVQAEVAPQRWVEMGNNEINRLPKEPVAVGDAWTRTEPAYVGGGQTLTFESRYTYLGEEEIDGVIYDRIGAEAIGVEYDIDVGPGAPFGVKESDLQIESSGGELLYNRGLRMVTQSETTMHITGTLTVTIPANDQELPSELDLTMSFKTNVEKLDES